MEVLNLFSSKLILLQSRCGFGVHLYYSLELIQNKFPTFAHIVGPHVVGMGDGDFRYPLPYRPRRFEDARRPGRTGQTWAGATTPKVNRRLPLRLTQGQKSSSQRSSPPQQRTKMKGVPRTRKIPVRSRLNMRRELE